MILYAGAGTGAARDAGFAVLTLYTEPTWLCPCSAPIPIPTPDPAVSRRCMPGLLAWLAARPPVP